MKIVCMLISILMLFVLSVVSYGDAEESMVLALGFDSGAGKTAVDSSRYGFDGEIQGTAWVDGKFGKALEFDGAGVEAVIVADDPELLLLESGTLMAWAFIMTESGHADWNRIMIKAADNGGTTNGYDFLFDRKLSYSVRFCVVACASNTPVETDSWHHVAITFDGEIITTYVDGENVNEIPQPGPTVDSTGSDLHIGNGAAFDRPYHGILDEVRIWNRALEADEIEAHMNMGTREVVAVEPNAKATVTWGQVKNSY